MPPKRSTRATQSSQTTTTRTTRAAPAAAPTTTSKPSRSTKPPPATHDSIEDGDTDDSDALLISTRPGRISSMATRRAREDRAPQDYTMTGGLGSGGGPPDGGKKTVRTRGRVVPKKVVRRDEGQARALAALQRRREDAERNDDDDDDDDDDEEETRGRRQRATVPPSSSPAVPATASRVRRASSSHWLNAPPSAVKAQGTPAAAAADTSVLALSMFRRRPRQPSLLRMMQQSDAENEGEDGADDSGLTLDYSLGDFEPDHESTPLNLGKGGGALGAEPRTSSSRKRKLAEREREEVQVPRSSPPVVEQVVVPRETSTEHLYSEASELPPLGVADTQPEPADEAVRSETMAPPRSTSLLSSIQVEQEREQEQAREATPAKRPRRAVRNITANSRAAARNAPGDDEEDHAADPLSSSDDDSASATETPVRSRNTRKKTNARKPKAMSLSTATLQSLLPRRRKKPATRGTKATAVEAFEIPSSDVEEEEESASDDEDVLQRAPAARRRKGTATKAVDSAAAEKKRKEEAAAAAGGGKKKRLSRTYGRRSSDKENQDGDVDASMYVRSGGESDGDEEVVVETSEMREVRKSRELEAAARKFAEVDEWEMEFESVDLGGASASSPWR